jgi:N-acetylmuramoyl-L-alanine amidase
MSGGIIPVRRKRSCDHEAVRVAAVLVLLSLSLAPFLHAQNAPAAPLVLVSREGRRPLATTIAGGQELIALDDIAALFQVAVREDTLAGGITITYRGRTVVLSANQPMASVAGRVITLPAPPVRSGGRWLVPVEFVPRALGPLLETRVDLRRPSRLMIVGDVAVPRVTARIDAVGPPTRATVEIAPAAPVRVTREGNRVVARIDAEALDIGLPADGGGLVAGFRPGDQPSTVFVVLDDRAGTARFTPTDSAGVTRIAVEVAPASAADAAPPPAAPAPAPPLPEAAPPPLLTTPRAVLQTIVIDPGHGGDDRGVRGSSGVEEKQITLQVARRLRTLIEMKLGIRVILTRDDDRSMSLDDRAAAANNNKADLFLSLHVNGSPVARIAGAEVFNLHLDREGEDARRTAQTDAVSLPVLGGATRTIDVIQWDLAQVRHVESSAALAMSLEEGLRGAKVKMSARPRQEAPLRLLTSVNMPAALIEMAYLTNTADQRLIRTDDYQNTVAQGIYDAVLRFRAYLEEQRPQ